MGSDGLPSGKEAPSFTKQSEKLLKPVDYEAAFLGFSERPPQTFPFTPESFPQLSSVAKGQQHMMSTGASNGGMYEQYPQP